MSSRLDVSLIVKVAQMYYLDGLKQEQIAKQVGISRSLISMILTEARERGIVEITIRDPLLNHDQLSRRLAAFYPKTTFTVVPTSSRDHDALRKLVAQRAADLLARSLGEGGVLGLAWGRTCFELVHAFRPKDRIDASVVPLIGGSFQTAPYFQINELVRVLADRMGGTPYFIHAPALVSDRKERDLYLASSAVQPVRQKWRAMDVLVTGIGALPPGGDPERENYIGEDRAFRQMARNGAVGDICARYFDRDGKFILDENYERVVGAPIEDLKKARTAICMASGPEKAEAIVGALRTGVVKNLVLDEPTAEAALELMAERKA
ncbi:MAG TPA: sugar-binding domain-containing protein [Anaeromyxobacteraceae bacterium]|nr:sugar-binding domain-containing protein [Anaeromyxobacteraceae bacterium]